MTYAELTLRYSGLLAGLRVAWQTLRRGLILSSAVLIALIISGGIFYLAPLAGLTVAHTNGISMEPTHHAGDVVLIRNVDGEKVQVGDIIMFPAATGRNVMHRVIERRWNENNQLVIVTQGDNVPVADKPILASDVTGKLVFKVPLLGELSRLMDAKGGIYVYQSLVLSLALSIVVVWGVKVTARRRGEPEPPEPTA